jgi:plasmid stabilization system protein ParE
VRIHWSDRAYEQVVEIFEYIARDRPNAAEGVLLSFLERVELLVSLPEQGQVWGDGSRPDLRVIFHESHRTVYRVADEELSVLSVRHTRMEGVEDEF